jgi:hypothetical protein
LESDRLKHHETYDVTKVTITKVDQNKNILVYAFDNVQINVTGGISLIGPNRISLIAGRGSFWVRSTRTENQGKIIVQIGDVVLSRTVAIEVE